MELIYEQNQEQAYLEGRTIEIFASGGGWPIYINREEFEGLKETKTIFECDGDWVFHDEEADDVYSQIGGQQYEDWWEDHGEIGGYEYAPSK